MAEFNELTALLRLFAELEKGEKLEFSATEYAGGRCIRVEVKNGSNIRGENLFPVRDFCYPYALYNFVPDLCRLVNGLRRAVQEQEAKSKATSGLLKDIEEFLEKGDSEANGS